MGRRAEVWQVVSYENWPGDFHPPTLTVPRSAWERSLIDFSRDMLAGAFEQFLAAFGQMQHA
jgi:hypothetical protein